MNILITGGAGYIGSHAIAAVRRAGHRPVALDNLQRGYRQAVPAEVPLLELDLRQTEAVTRALREHQIACVMHFAALAYVGESVRQPLLYYENNTAGSLSLLQAMQAAGVKRLVFSSTCATYGEPETMPITEAAPQAPINPYGRSKLMVEHILRDLAAADPEFSYAALRYFNVAGSAADGSIGENHEPETHLLPLLLLAALGRVEYVTLFGDDYPTPDGTCIRDYIHVEDLTDAHVAVAEALKPGEQRFYNLGIGRGYSVKECIAATEAVTGRKLPVKVGPRRPGDPPILYANADRIRHDLGWQPRYIDLQEIIATAWRWFRDHRA